MATTPVYWQAMHEENGVTITTANANIDGLTGTYGTVATGVAAGTRIDGVWISCPDTNTEDRVRLFHLIAGTVAVRLADIYIGPRTKGVNAAGQQFYHKFSGIVDLFDTDSTLIASTLNGGDFTIVPVGKDMGS
jgi:hypothetical protein